MNRETKQDIDSIVMTDNIDDLAFYLWNRCREGDGDGIAVIRYALEQIRGIFGRYAIVKTLETAHEKEAEWGERPGWRIFIERLPEVECYMVREVRE